MVVAILISRANLDPLDGQNLRCIGPLKINSNATDQALSNTFGIDRCSQASLGGTAHTHTFSFGVKLAHIRRQRSAACFDFRTSCNNRWPQVVGEETGSDLPLPSAAVHEIVCFYNVLDGPLGERHTKVGDGVIYGGVRHLGDHAASKSPNELVLNPTILVRQQVLGPIKVPLGSAQHRPFSIGQRG